MNNNKLNIKKSDAILNISLENNLRNIKLVGKSITLPIEKWNRDYQSSNVIVKTTKYTSTLTENKRKIVFDQNRKSVATKNIHLTL